MRIFIEFLIAAILIVGLTHIMTKAYETMMKVKAKNEKQEKKKERKG